MQLVSLNITLLLSISYLLFNFNQLLPVMQERIFVV